MPTPEKYMPKQTGQFLGKCVEECGELLAALGKTQRWGLFSVNPELPPEQQELNRDWILREMEDVEEAINMLREHIDEHYYDPNTQKDFIQI